jgi:hypothetical protein
MMAVFINNLSEIVAMVFFGMGGLWVGRRFPKKRKAH